VTGTAATEPAPVEATAPAPVARAGLRGSLLAAVAGVTARLPEGPLVAAAESIGELWYRVAPERRAQARANLGRVCEGLAATERGSAAARRAASDPDALERLVRASFRHAARYYLEVARAGGYDLDAALARLDVDDEATVRASLAGGGAVIIVGMHFGAIELPVVLLAHLAGRRVTAPMEAVSDPGLQRWFVESRGRIGVNIIPLTDARRTLLRELRAGRPIGLVADRDLTRTGIDVPLFGHPAPIAVGPALLAMETGAPVLVGAARRVAGGRYRCRLFEVPAPDAGSRRERIVAHTAAIAAGFETVLADAPEQWWGAFHPIWPDLDLSSAPPAEDRP
jgi:KDO2-lipid IV(A) lauroyltransferase